MGADPEYGRRRPCARDCCEVNTRAQEREAVRTEIADGLVDAHKIALEDALNPGRVEALTEFELENAVRGASVSPPGPFGPAWVREMLDGLA